MLLWHVVVDCLSIAYRLLSTLHLGVRSRSSENFFDIRFMSNQFTISQLAETAGIPTSTVRYYERVGLIQPESRSHSNYRLYGNESVQRLKFVRAAQATGFTLDDIKTLLSSSDGESPKCGNVQALIEERLSDVGQRLKDLRNVRRVLRSALEQCHEQTSEDACQVVEGLRKQA